MLVGHDSFICNGRVIYSFESLITPKQPLRNMRGRQIHLFTFDGNNFYILLLAMTQGLFIFKVVICMIQWYISLCKFHIEYFTCIVSFPKNYIHFHKNYISEELLFIRIIRYIYFHNSSVTPPKNNQ